jgi:hypothetical protein
MSKMVDNSVGQEDDACHAWVGWKKMLDFYFVSHLLITFCLIIIITRLIYYYVTANYGKFWVFGDFK